MFANIIVWLLDRAGGVRVVTNKGGQNSQNVFDIAAARQAYLDWERTNAQEFSENYMRRRAVDLSVLVRDVIEEDLSQTERAVVEQYWFEEKNLSTIASSMGVNRATVCRTLQRANSKIQAILRHVVKYQYDLKNVVFLPIAVREALAIASADKSKPSSIGGRLRRLRIMQNISIESLSGAVSIDKNRLISIEGGALPSLPEVIKLAAFYQTTTDNILTGG